MKRRQFIQSTAGAGLALGTVAVPFAARAASSKVVVVGGGMAGAAVAKYIRLWSRGTISVTLIEKDAAYVSNILSNEVVTGKRTSIDSLVYAYSALTTRYGVQRIQGTVTGMDDINKAVTYETAAGGHAVLTYDSLVLAPGLDFDLMPGMTGADQYDTLVPHAWKAGAQTTLLRRQLLALQDWQNVVITVPLAPYRCPPGPYERACVIADWLRTRKPNSNVVVLDANLDIQAQKANFQNAFNGTYGYRVDYRAGCTVNQLQLVAGAHTVTYTRDGVTASVAAAVLNPIPPQRAPSLLARSGLLTGKFAPVNLLSYESTLKPGIHVIGDACISGMPKAGHIGNQEAKTCANAIVNALMGSQYALAETSPVLNSACYTPVTSTRATWLSAVYQYANGVMVPSTENGVTQPRVATSATAGNYEDMEKWFATLMGDTFG